MTAPVRAEEGDAFGDSVGERVWRRLAGAGAAVMPVAALAVTAGATEALPWVLFGALVVYVLGVPASWVVSRRGRAPVRGHVFAAFGLGILVAAGLAAFSDEFLAWWGIFALVAVGTGVPLAALAAWVGPALPPRWVHPVAIVGLVVMVVVLPVGAWWAQRPPAPYDFVVVHEPDAVRESFGDAYALAEVLAERFEQRAQAGEPRTAHATWAAVGADLSDRELASIASWQRFTSDQDLPTLAGTGQPVRLVTTIFEGEATRGCVVVTADASSAFPAACADLDLTD